MTVSIVQATHPLLKEVLERSSYAGDEANAEAVRTFYRRSAFAWVGLVDEQAACAYGLIAPSLINEVAYLWLLTNSLVDQHQFAFVRHSQIETRKMLLMFPRIIGHVVEGEERSKRWLKWLGVRLGKRENGFIEFELRSA